MNMSLLGWCLVPVFALAACSKTDDAAPPASQSWPGFDAPAQAASATPLPRPCSLLTAEQVREVLQFDAAQMEDDPEACIWWAMPGVGNVVMLTLQLQQAGSEKEARELYSAIAGMQGNLAGIVNAQADSSTRKSGQDVDDLGDEAWLSGATFGDPAGGQNDKRIINGSVLTVRQGKRILNLNITGSLVDKGLGKRMVALMRGIKAKL